MFSEERKLKMLNMLKEKNSIKVNDMAVLFNVSESTIRRDLEEMEKMNLLTRTHGGAVSITNTAFEPTYVEKEIKMLDEKINIGKIAALKIKKGDTIILDSGTTTLEIAKHIITKDITVITNSIDIACELSHKEGIQLIVTGGIFRYETRALTGQITEDALKNFRVDKAFLGANGISSEEGITTPKIVEAQVKKSMIKSAREVIIVADSSKFNKVCFSFICNLKEINSIITDTSLDEKIKKSYESLGIEIIDK